MSDILFIVASIAGIATTVYSVIMVVNTRKRYYEDYLKRKRPERSE